MYYTLATQVAALLPSSTPAGLYNVTVTYAGQTSAAVSVNVVERNFGFGTEAADGQGPAQALTRISGSSLGAIYAARGFNCTAQASEGSFTVPANILQQLPAVSNDATSSTFGVLSLFAVPDIEKGQGAFTAPLKSGAAIDVGVLGYEIAFTKIIRYN